MFQHSSMQKHVGQDTGVTGCVSLLSKAAFAFLAATDPHKPDGPALGQSLVGCFGFGTCGRCGD